ncbi:hypothetical protein OH76DRAFT_187663 [Lentinus brumalis]|uniref:Uncharacterized protein n=1 Tax=Lentinus brumalis TaxID=2498619 RepID=A0A371CMW3_9APHY|nr:hypothetical protein OH76DRAFT_187663 [Polyporus brumalis]
MPYVRSRKFCCCLPVRFGVFCESILGLAVGGFFSVVAWIEINKFMHGQLQDLSQSDKTALWVVAATMTFAAVTSFLGLIGAIGRVRPLVAIYATVLTGVTVLDIIGGIYLIVQLFHGYGDDQVKKCQDQADKGAQGTVDVEHWACSEGFKVGRTILVVVYVIWWLIEIYGCVIAFGYVSQLNEEEEAKNSDREKNQSQNVTIVTQPAAAFGQPQPYPFSESSNAYGPQGGQY